MKLVMVFIALFPCHFLVAQDVLSMAKAQVIREIVQKTAKVEKDQKIVVVADLGSREMITSSGVAGTYIKYKEVKYDDSIAIQTLRESFLVKTGELLSFKTFKEVAYNNRNEVIEKYFYQGPGLTNSNMYVEIAAPIGGWEVGDLFLADKSFFNEDRYMHYQKPRFWIPVYVWKSDQKGGKEVSKTYLFRYDLSYSNKQLIVKLIDSKEI